MSKVQQVFDRIQKTKKEIRGINLIYRDALCNSKSYQDLNEEIREFKGKRKMVSDAIKDDFSSEFSKLDTLKLDLENDQMLLSDAALTKLISGETVEVVDDKNNKYDPLFKVGFIKN